MGVDPAKAKPSTYAVWYDYHFVNAGHIHSVHDFYYLLKGLYGPAKVYIEDQYLGFNYKTAKMLSLEAGKLMGACEIAGISYEVINVAHWKSLMGLSDKENKKQRLLDKASQIYPTDDEDIAAAILIGCAAILDEDGVSML